MASKKKPQIQPPAWKIDKNVKLAIGTAGLIGTIAVGVWAFEARYAKAEEMDRKFDALQTTIVRGQQRSEFRALEAEIRSLRREQFDIQSVQERRKAEKKTLTDLEANRLKQVSEEIGRIDGELKTLKQKEMEEIKK